MKRVGPFLLFAITLLSHFVSYARAQDSPKKVALLVGVNKYLKPGFKNLDYAERDVTELEKELKKLGFKTVLLTGSASGALRATRKNIEEQLQKLVRDVGKQDIVLVALSGHGQQLNVPKPGGGTRDDGFYCPYDAVKDSPETLFSLSYLTDDILAKNGGRNLLLVDACRDVPKDPGKGGRGVEGKIVSLPENTAIFFSCSAGQESWENDELKHGVFTYCLLEGLRGTGVNGGDISWSNLIAHVDQRMSSAEIKKYLLKPQEPISAGGVPRTVLGTLPKPNGGTNRTEPKSAEPKPSNPPPAKEVDPAPADPNNGNPPNALGVESRVIVKSQTAGYDDASGSSLSLVMGIVPKGSKGKIIAHPKNRDRSQVLIDGPAGRKVWVSRSQLELDKP